MKKRILQYDPRNPTPEGDTYGPPVRLVLHFYDSMVPSLELRMEAKIVLKAKRASTKRFKDDRGQGWMIVFDGIDEPPSYGRGGKWMSVWGRLVRQTKPARFALTEHYVGGQTRGWEPY